MLDENTSELMRLAMRDLNRSARAYDCIQKLARPVAGLAGAETMHARRIAEANQCRSLDCQLWA